MITKTEMQKKQIQTNYLKNIYHKKTNPIKNTEAVAILSNEKIPITKVTSKDNVNI